MRSDVQFISAGVDEVGRGPLAGPVFAAAVVLPQNYDLDGLTDSKRLTAKKRASLDLSIREQALHWSIGRAEVVEIDQINIFQATLLAMKRALESLDIVPDISLIDGKWAPDVACETKTVIHGDLLEPSISAASIVAKVARDKEMCRLDMVYPGYGFYRNKGYATSQHLDALQIKGPCNIHRTSFLPVRNVMNLQTAFKLQKTGQ